MKDSFYSSQGRIGPVAFLYRVLLMLLAVAYIFYAGIDYFSHDEKHEFLMPLAYFFGIVALIVALFCILMQLIKRLNDIGRKPFWSILLLVPVVNVLLLLYAAFAPAKTKSK